MVPQQAFAPVVACASHAELEKFTQQQGIRTKSGAHMQILAMVSLMAFLILVLLVFSLVTPRDSRGAGSRETGFYTSSDSHGPAPSTKQ